MNMNHAKNKIKNEREKVLIVRKNKLVPGGVFFRVFLIDPQIATLLYCTLTQSVLL